MSDVIRRLNAIKVHRNEHWLTPSQATVLASLREALRMREPVNLYGRIGVGKTFLGWLLADVLGYLYLSDIRRLDELEESSLNGLVIDNVPSQQQAFRRLLIALNFLSVRQSILISREPIQDDVRRVELKLTTIDIEHVRANLMGAELSLDWSEPVTLWQLVNPHL